jgi:hypothetical protein
MATAQRAACSAAADRATDASDTSLPVSHDHTPTTRSLSRTDRKHVAGIFALQRLRCARQWRPHNIQRDKRIPGIPLSLSKSLSQRRGCSAPPLLQQGRHRIVERYQRELTRGIKRCNGTHKTACLRTHHQRSDSQPDRRNSTLFIESVQRHDGTACASAFT